MELLKPYGGITLVFRLVSSFTNKTNGFGGKASLLFNNHHSTEIFLFKAVGSHSTVFTVTDNKGELTTTTTKNKSTIMLKTPI